MNKITDATEQRPVQLALPVQPASVVVPLQFRVSETTARRGLQHVAELRRLLADRQAARESAPRPTPVIRRHAA